MDSQLTLPHETITEQELSLNATT